MKDLIHQKETLLQVSLKNNKTTQVLSWLKLKTNPKLLDFAKTNTNEIKRFIEKLDPKKTFQKSGMSTNILKKI